MPMKCDKLLNDALNLHIDPEARAALNAMRKPAISGYTPKEGIGIDINSKLMTALEKIKQTHTRDKTGNVQFRPETIRKLLQRDGVSKGEIETSLSKILDNPNYHENGKVSIDYLTGAGRVSSLKVTDETKQGYLYNTITYNKQGMAPDSKYSIRHVRGEAGREVEQGHFENVVDSLGWSRQYEGTLDGRKVWRLDEIQSDFFQSAPPRYLKDFTARTGVSYNDVKKILIVDALDQAIKNGHTTMIIPITRSANYLTGSIDVSNIYRDLNTGILPKIRKELDKVDLKLDIKHVVDKQETIEVSQVESAFMGNPRLRYNEEEWKEIYGYFGADLDYVDINQQDFKKFITDVSSNIGPENTKILKKIEQELFNPESFVITLKDKTGKPLFTKESYVPSVLHSKSREMEAFVDMMKANEVLTHKASYYIKYSNSDLKLSEILNLSLPEDEEQITKIWETAAKYEKVNKEKGIKYRWDALSILSALGLGEAYNKLQEQAN